MEIPGQHHHAAPDKVEQWRLVHYRPYLREANSLFRSTWHIGPRRLLDYLLVQILEGTGHFQVGDDTFEVSAGDLIWIPPNTIHEMWGDVPGNRLQYIHFDLLYEPCRSHWSAGIPGGIVDLSSCSSLMHPLIDDPVVSSWSGLLYRGDPAVVSDYLRRIVLAYQQSMQSSILISGLLLQLLNHLIENPDETKQSRRHQVVMQQAMRRIHLHGGSRIDLDLLARESGMSLSHFRKCFRAYHGKSPRDAMIQSQMAVALDYVMYSDMTISQIADELGFSTVHNFSRAFRRYTGKPPSAYRGKSARRET